MRLFIAVVAAIVCSAPADTGIQYDWSGGPGVQGPVTDWGNSFLSSIHVDWCGSAGNLLLKRTSAYDLIRPYAGLKLAKPCMMDNDGYPDVFATDGNGNTEWYHNVSGGDQWGSRSFADTEGIRDIATGDIDGDGGIDVFASVDDYPNKGFYWFERLNDKGTQWEMHDICTGDQPDRVFTVDVDGDGDSDLIGTYSRNKINISWWENQNSGQTWVKHVISEDAREHGMTSLDVSDCDNDGDYDIACGSHSDSVYLFVNQGNDLWEFHGIEYESEGDLRVVSFADIDGDNSLDIVTSTLSSSSNIVWFRNTGNVSSWEMHIVTIAPGYAHPAMVGDIDGDGDVDIVASIEDAIRDESRYSWWENVDPHEDNWTIHQAESEEASSSEFYVQDVNQDGRCDVVAGYRNYSAPYLDKVAWWNFDSGNYTTAEAQLESSILYVYDVNWGSIDWSAVTPPGTSVCFEVRSSDDPDSMGSWSGVITSPGSLSSYLTPDDSYLQYRVTLSTTDSTVTPVLENVVLTWSNTGVEGSEGCSEASLHVLENPTAGSVRFGISLPSISDVSLAVYDAAGRTVGNTITGEYPPGTTVVQFDMLAPGTYFCRVETGGNSFTEQFTVVEN
jgi:hypothetical protein